ncbi:17996_t:CDS:2, partial [Cetraspora pellucida]
IKQKDLCLGDFKANEFLVKKILNFWKTSCLLNNTAQPQTSLTSNNWLSVANKEVLNKAYTFLQTGIQETLLLQLK